ncbi:MAG: NADH-quinone oxidoreductase subunit M [Candidatus Omnitrophica bacterium]|nr:NADH-quinone oxidoreductase subunit M [Candidatus Omnitrophota bacterium]
MILSSTIFIPLGAATLVMLMKPQWRREIKIISAMSGVLCLVISAYLCLTYDTAKGGLQFVEMRPWIPTLGASYYLGVDGMNLSLVLLTAFIMLTGVFIAWNIDDRTKEFFALFLILVSGVFGVFVSMDLFLLFIFYELAVLPMYLLIGYWGSTRKEYGAMKLTLYLLAGSALLFFGMLALYFKANIWSFNLTELAKISYPESFQKWVFPFIFVGFAVLGGLWPLHTWSPVGHVAAPTSVSMLHAGVLMKLGAYGCLRVAILTFPQGAQFWAPYIAALTAVNIVYGSMVAMVQTDTKYVIGYSSVSHMGFVILGLCTLNEAGISGAVLQMFSHGIMTGLFFAVVGRFIYDRTHTRELKDLGGLRKPLPWANVAFIIAGLASMGLPGLSGFIAELHILIGVWERFPLIAALCGIAIVITAAYILRVIHRTFYGELNPKFASLPPETIQEKVSVAILCAVLIVVGIYPVVLLDTIHSAVDPTVKLLHHVQPAVPLEQITPPTTSVQAVTGAVATVTV